MVIARNSNLLGKITILVMVGLCVNTAVALDGSGTQEDPWLIKSLDDFNDFAADANYWDDYTRLETDVNLAGLTYTTAVIAPDTDNSNEYIFDGTAFTGVFDGNDHKVINLTIDGGTNDYLGLFGYIIDGEVKNLGLEGGFVSGEYSVGGLAGWNNGSVSNSYSTRDVNGVYVVGGLVGCHDVGTINNCYSTGSVKGVEHVGGLVGHNVGLPPPSSSIISNCYAESNVSGFDTVGGLVGINLFFNTIKNCYAKGSVKGEYKVGGLVGENLDTITSCYSTSSVDGNFHIGGLLGINWMGGTASNCYSAGNVNGYEIIGGLVGFNDNSTINNCYSTGSVKGVEHVGGLVGHNRVEAPYNSFWDIKTSNEPNMCGQGEYGDCDNSYGKTTAEMKQQSTFTDWDFINVWNIGENQTYPYLRIYLPSDINKDGIVNFLDVAITANQWMEEQ
jgi:hypothetical protein